MVTAGRDTFATDEKLWALATFGQSALGDRRLTKRLVDMATRLASQIGTSMAACCNGDAAAQSGSYRLLRNDSVAPDAIAQGGFGSTVRQIDASQRLLALEDTTSVSYRHAVADELGATSKDKSAKAQGYLVHSVLLIDSDTEFTLGLIDQQRWCRDAAEHGKKHKRKQRAYADKESFKWQRSSEQMTERLGAQAMQQVISVCDRESDVYEYLHYKHEQKQRFVTRASVDRRIQGHTQRLFATLAEQAEHVGCKSVPVPQRGGRKARTAQVKLCTMPLTLCPPRHDTSRAGEALPVHAILVQEVDAPEGVKPLQWRLLTSEPINDLQAVLRVVRDYETRWRIEEFHKAWKSGAGVERQRLQHADNLERMMVITAFVAVRLLQLRERMETERASPGDTKPMSIPLESDEWRLLWVSAERNKPLPDQPPSARWAYLALAKLGGFTDTKRTGRPGWATLWRGWFRLQERLEGYRLSQQLQKM